VYEKCFLEVRKAEIKITVAIEYMKLTNLSIALVLSEMKNAELEKKVKGFESLTKALSMEIDAQRQEIELMKQNGKVLKFNQLRKVA
jgi:hypothetical protein